MIAIVEADINLKIAFRFLIVLPEPQPLSIIHERLELLLHRKEGYLSYEYGNYSSYIRWITSTCCAPLKQTKPRKNMIAAFQSI
jgi:hypothetical protein